MPQATNALFTPTELSNWLRQPVADESAWMVETVVWGWLRPVLQLTERPEVTSDELKAWAIELGAIAYVNPEGLGSYALETEKSVYSGERRAELLGIAASGGTDVGPVPGPRGTFPPAPCDDGVRW
jgi:hypothetical protein